MIKIENLKKSYGTGTGKTEVLKGINLEIQDKEFLVLLGASGSGKSTLLNLISGLEKTDSGKVFYNDQDITKLSEKDLTAFRRTQVAFVFQQYYLLPNLTTQQNIRLGSHLAQNDSTAIIIQALGLENLIDKLPSQLSGGQQQRVAIARAVAKEPKILFLDEPTGALDEATGREVLDYLLQLQKSLGFTMVMVTHNANIAETANRVVHIASGVIAHETVNQNLKSAYEIGW
ncbi:ABC transporter ATP-binding protein [Enterococcus faecalis]|nr:ABC transporter ATP-binding protein [Enterococcus faecalis]